MKEVDSSFERAEGHAVAMGTPRARAACTHQQCVEGVDQCEGEAVRGEKRGEARWRWGAPGSGGASGRAPWG